MYGSQEQHDLNLSQTAPHSPPNPWYTEQDICYDEGTSRWISLIVLNIFEKDNV